MLVSKPPATMKRTYSLDDNTKTSRRLSSSSSPVGQSPIWDISKMPSSTNNIKPVLFDRRGSNGVIPGQQITNPPLSLRPRSRREHEEEGLHSSMGRIRPRRRSQSRIYDDPAVVAGYNSVPLMKLDRLPRGGISLETKAVGRIQFGIPPETIKDSMNQGFDVPSAYIVPVERFCREMGPALGINLAEFEFPAYFNYFVKCKRCTLVVDSIDAEENIRRVFGETLLGPAQFRDHLNPKPNEDEDFDPGFPREARPNFYKEFYNFRTAEKSTNYQELTIDTLLEFCHFKGSLTTQGHNAVKDKEKLGVPPIPIDFLQAGEENVDKEIEERATRRYTLTNAEDEKALESLEDSARYFQEDALCAASMSNFNDLEEERPPLRRTMSDPDVRKVSIEDLLKSIPEGSEEPVPKDSEKGSDMGFPPRRMARRSSMDSMNSFMSRDARSRDGLSWASGVSSVLESDEEDDHSKNSWLYSKANWLGDVATVYPTTATDEQKRTNSCARVEIFKMSCGTQYIIHDVDENNIIVGKARFSGTVRVPDEMAVEGFLTRDPEDFKGDVDCESSDDEGPLEMYSDHDSDDDVENLFGYGGQISRRVAPPTFHPPSFGVTVLGNSHGFDKNGSVSGYVLWINGRGVMIDPPPYSSATLEREGIRPQMIMAIIITHCHADHDAGTFQKVMTGSRVAIITTPTIYKSFIRKYAALSGLSPTLLRHSHRHRPAIVGQPLKFQGATFNFTYTLHTIPCISFKVEWRGRSMVFTGDHLNSPPMIEKLEEMGVLTKERADDLRQMPLQACDVLLHEAGAPPIHTPLKVLSELPEEVKARLYVVHTSALPEDSDLRVAPTGTAGTIRLDELHIQQQSPCHHCMDGVSNQNTGTEPETFQEDELTHEEGGSVISTEGTNPSEPYAQHNHSESCCFPAVADDEYQYYPTAGSASNIWGRDVRGRKARFGTNKLPLVFLRPTCVSDAWFILNLLSNVPFLSSLSYANTMEVLEIAMVEMFAASEIVIPAHRRSEVLCVVWEGTCVEREVDCIDQVLLESELSIADFNDQEYAHLDRARPTVWHAGDWTGPVALQPDVERSAELVDGEPPKDVVALSTEGVKVIMLNMKDLHQILKSGSKLFRKYLSLKEKQAAEEAAMKAQTLQSEAEMGNFYDSKTDLAEQSPTNWYAGYDSVLEVLKCNSALGKLRALQKRHLESLAEGPQYFESGQYLWQVGEPVKYAFLIVAGTAMFAQRPDEESFLTRRNSIENKTRIHQASGRSRMESLRHVEEDKLLFNVPPNSEYARLESRLQLRVEEMEMDVYVPSKDLLPQEERARNARDRYANKVLTRLYSRKAYTAGLVFSRGHLLSDTSRMVSGNLALIHRTRQENLGSMSHGYFGDHHCHTSNMVAGPDGCVVMVFPRSNLVQFLDGNPGVLLSLLGTQVVV